MNEIQIKPWMRGILLLAGVYNLAWGLFMVAFPESFISWLSGGQIIQETNALYLQARMILLFGALMILLGIKLQRWYHLIWIAIAVKIIGPFITYFVLLEELFTKKLIFHVVMNDLVWLIPFAAILLSMKTSDRQSK